ncbi:MAG: glycosyltransferase family 87 protein [Bacteroidetes bacterium]|nr:glycosyltransferase family 87 protein [Bacteroidota bacterium]
MILKFFSHPIFKNKYFLLGLWVLVALVVGIKQYTLGTFGVYKIYKDVFDNLIAHKNLYKFHPEFYDNRNYYGPLFGLMIAPFALLPNWLGVSLWILVNAIVLFVALWKLPLTHNQKIMVGYICLNELITSLLNSQFNPLTAAFLIFSFVFIEKKKDFWAAFFICLGVFTKLYGIMGLAFFFFSNNKIKFVLSLVFWSVVFFLLPMLLSSPSFVIQSYQDWYHALIYKNSWNADLTSHTDISVMGMARRISGNPNLSNLPFMAAGAILFAMPYLKISNYKNTNFRLMFLASALLFTVLFSTGSESPTYIIAFCGVAIWFVLQPPTKSILVIALLVFALIVTSFSPTDFFPEFIRDNVINPYSLKALPCLFVWLFLIWQMMKLPTTAQE